MNTSYHNIQEEETAVLFNKQSVEVNNASKLPKSKIAIGLGLVAVTSLGYTACNASLVMNLNSEKGFFGGITDSLSNMLGGSNDERFAHGPGIFGPGSNEENHDESPECFKAGMIACENINENEDSSKFCECAARIDTSTCPKALMDEFSNWVAGDCMKHDNNSDVICGNNTNQSCFGCDGNDYDSCSALDGEGQCEAGICIGGTGFAAGPGFNTAAAHGANTGFAAGPGFNTAAAHGANTGFAAGPGFNTAAAHGANIGFAAGPGFNTAAAHGANTGFATGANTAATAGGHYDANGNWIATTSTTGNY